jgi:lysophospholipase L1-like esterase
LGLRLFGLGSPEGAIDSLHVYSEVYGWAPRPGIRQVDAGVVTTINAHGYRGEALPEAKSGKRRIVVIGDSVAFGLYVQDSDTFAAALQAGRDDVEVANLAVQGYGPGQELTKLEREGLPLRPDVVVVATCLSNDLADALLPAFLYDGIHPKPYHRIEDGALVRYDAHLRLTARARLAVFLRRHSRLIALLRAPSAPEASEAIDWGSRKRRALKDEAAALELTAELLATMAARGRDAGAQFVVLAFPDREEWDGLTRWRRRLARSPAMRDVKLVDMALRFRDAGLDYDDFALDRIGHLSPRGHRETAHILEHVLKMPPRPVP